MIGGGARVPDRDRYREGAEREAPQRNRDEGNVSLCAEQDQRECNGSDQERATADCPGRTARGDGAAGKVVSLPTREQINLPVQEQLIVELYSK